MKTIEQALAYADTLNRPEDKYLSVVILAAEVRRLREENERQRFDILAMNQSLDLLREENERLREDVASLKRYEDAVDQCEGGCLMGCSARVED